jgi:hypothetical protein
LYQYNPVSAFLQVPGFFVRREALRIELAMRWLHAGRTLAVRWRHVACATPVRHLTVVRMLLVRRLQPNPSS